MKKDLYEMITNKIIEKLEEGVVPWQKPFFSSSAVNWKTQKPYRGINALILDGGEYATFKQITESGGKVKKGEKGHMVVFWTFLDKEDEKGDEIKIPFLRYYTVFEINKQCEGLKSKRKAKVIEKTKNEINQDCEAIIKNYPNAPKTEIGEKAYYVPLLDKVVMPKLKNFINSDSYYSTFFHELVHSTGHQTRLKREGITNSTGFGSHLYSKEELVAEIGASFLNGVAGIDSEELMNNSASYLNSWLRALKNDTKLIVTAAGQAQRAVDHILDTQFED